MSVEYVQAADLGAEAMSTDDLMLTARESGGVAGTVEAVAAGWSRLPSSPSLHASGLPNASFTWYPDAPFSLTPGQCDQVLRATDKVAADRELDVIDAEQRAMARDRAWTMEELAEVEHVFDHVMAMTLLANRAWWRLAIDGWAGGVRGYVAPHGLPTHADLESGNDRLKLAVSVLLTDPNEFDGGALEILFGSSIVTVPRRRGTIVVFPAWLAHRVDEVSRGERRSLVLAAVGPPLR